MTRYLLAAILPICSLLIGNIADGYSIAQRSLRILASCLGPHGSTLVLNAPEAKYTGTPAARATLSQHHHSMPVQWNHHHATAHLTS